MNNGELIDYRLGKTIKYEQDFNHSENKTILTEKYKNKEDLEYMIKHWKTHHKLKDTDEFVVDEENLTITIIVHYEM